MFPALPLLIKQFSYFRISGESFKGKASVWLLLNTILDRRLTHNQIWALFSHDEIAQFISILIQAIYPRISPRFDPSIFFKRPRYNYCLSMRSYIKYNKEVQSIYDLEEVMIKKRLPVVCALTRIFETHKKE